MTEMASRILIVEDDPDIAELVAPVSRQGRLPDRARRVGPRSAADDRREAAGLSCCSI
jgi:DNA-binding response OmpR family regulator